jgi:polyisoprenoid-binding protein YceI
VTLTFALQRASPEADSISFTAATHINRRDWSVEWPPPLETGGMLVGDRIGIEIQVVAKRTE